MTCHSWNDVADYAVMLGGSKNEVIDTPLKVGRAFGVTGGVLGGLFLIFLPLTTFMVIHKSLLIAFGNIVGIFLALFSLTLGGVGLFTNGCVVDCDDDNYYSDPYNSCPEGKSTLHCVPTVKGYLAGGAFLLWIVGTSIVCCCMGNPRSVQVPTDNGAQLTVGTDQEYVKEGSVLYGSHTAHASTHFDGNETEVEVEGSNCA